MKLLLVEDDARLADVVAGHLADSGYTVDSVADGADALAMAQDHDYDVILLDVLIPIVDGYEVARRLRKMGIETPILMLTARDAISDRVTGLDAGADDYLVKPFALAELLARIRALLRRSRQDADGGTRLVCGDLELDLLGREAIRQGQHIELTRKEFALLEELMRHPGQVLTRSQLLERVWSYDVMTDSNVVDIYIYYLRNKIDREFTPKRLRTVRGLGYVLRSG